MKNKDWAREPVNEMNHAKMSQLHTMTALIAEGRVRRGSDEADTEENECETPPLNYHWKLHC